jgi:hypothetical protein
MAKVQSQHITKYHYTTKQGNYNNQKLINPQYIKLVTE